MRLELKVNFRGAFKQKMLKYINIVSCESFIESSSYFLITFFDIFFFPIAKTFMPRNVDLIIQNASRKESEVAFKANIVVTRIPSGCFLIPLRALFISRTEINFFSGIFCPDLLACLIASHSKSIKELRNSFDPCK